MTGRIGRIGFAISFLLAVASDRVFAQENSTPLSPSEAYKAALAPFNAAKAQRDDLTDADKFALGIGMAQAVIAVAIALLAVAVVLGSYRLLAPRGWRRIGGGMRG